ncbi:(d)CMP kinase [Limibaculum sp. M0105]|uniref:Cytidylate kinase n=1 Tax=Thermohalobaculum xanthum TaxID=2753746 RepID=A0A8J7SIP9_9RHOB|nr:(d)CMP kinase [Thermohalobaculum xanthum]MBK0400475.1 (d)CMP kinase [Thermohalobaculum xanthum]
MSFVVAIDGPAAAGKGTIGRRIAERFGFAHLDTGLLYRAVGKRAIDIGRGVIDDGVAEIVARELTPADLDQPGLRSILVARAASKVAALPAVRKALLDFQRDFARRPEGVVLDGRDIGTVICPDAAVKLFVTASAEERARRRQAELAAKGEAPSFERVLADVRDRDARDAARADAPMVQASDAILLDTTELDIETAVAKAAEIIEQALSRAGRS